MIVFTSDEVSENALALTGRSLDMWAWSEALHVGPIGKTHDLVTFARDRALVFQYHGWDESKEVEADFTARNEALIDALENEEEEIVLLFGPGIRDQLSLARLAAWLKAQASQALARVKISVEGGALAAESGEALWNRIDRAESLEDTKFDVYESVWTAFVSDDPTKLEACLQSLEEGLLKDAVDRFLREYPSVENGLSLSECQILDALSLGVTGPKELFEACRETESVPFLNNWEFWATLQRMTSGKSPLIETANGDSFMCPPRSLAWTAFEEQNLALTPFGERALKAEEHCGLDGFQERWIGGVQLAADRLWFWNYQTNCLTREPKIPSVL